MLAIPQPIDHHDVARLEQSQRMMQQCGVLGGQRQRHGGADYSLAVAEGLDRGIHEAPVPEVTDRRGLHFGQATLHGGRDGRGHFAYDELFHVRAPCGMRAEYACASP